MSGRGQIEPRWKKGESGNPKGRPKGVKNRATIARYWMEIEQSAKNPITGANEKMSQEDLMTLAQIKKAREGDVQAYKALMDSCYGAPIQQIQQEQTTIDLTELSTEDIKSFLSNEKK